MMSKAPTPEELISLFSALQEGDDHTPPEGALAEWADSLLPEGFFSTFLYEAVSISTPSNLTRATTEEETTGIINLVNALKSLGVTEICFHKVFDVPAPRRWGLGSRKERFTAEINIYEGPHVEFLVREASAPGGKGWTSTLGSLEESWVKFITYAPPGFSAKR